MSRCIQPPDANEDIVNTQPSDPSSDPNPNRQVAQRQGRVVVWGCKEHQTPAGEECQGCADQGELFTRAEATKSARTSPYHHRRPQ